MTSLALALILAQLQPPLIVQDEGVQKGANVSTINCTGAGLTCSVSGQRATFAAGAGGGTPGGADTQVQFNDGGVFGGDADLTWNKTTNVLTFGTASGSNAIGLLSGARLSFGGSYVYGDGTDWYFGNGSTGWIRVAALAAGYQVAAGTFVPFAAGASLALRGQVATSGTAVANKMGNSVALTTAGDKILSFYSDAFITEKAYIDKDGMGVFGALALVSPLAAIYGGTGLAAAAIDSVLLANPANTWTAAAVPSCSGATNAITYNTTTHAWGCNSIAGGGAPTTAGYWTKTADATLTNEMDMSALASGLILNTITTGVPTIYAGTSCTNQFNRSLNASGAATCAGVGVADFTANQGTTTTYLTGNAAGQPSWGGLNLTAGAIANQGATTTLLHGNAAGQPSWSAVALGTDVSGTLPIGNGGTNGTATPTAGGVAYGTGTALAWTAAGTASQCLLSNAASPPTWGSCSGAGGGAPRTVIPLGGTYTTAVFTVAAADPCAVAGTNLNTTYKTYGLQVSVTMDSFTKARINLSAKNAGGQSGAIQCRIYNVTDAAAVVGPTTTITSTTCTQRTTQATGLALTGQKVLRCECLSSVATDDPIFGPCTLELEP